MTSDAGLALMRSAKSVSEAPRGSRTTVGRRRGGRDAAQRRGRHVVELLAPLLLATCDRGAGRPPGRPNAPAVPPRPRTAATGTAAEAAAGDRRAPPPATAATGTPGEAAAAAGPPRPPGPPPAAAARPATAGTTAPATGAAGTAGPPGGRRTPGRCGIMPGDRAAGHRDAGRAGAAAAGTPAGRGRRRPPGRGRRARACRCRRRR